MHGATTEQATVLIEVSPGELIDKITILEIKRSRITNEAKLVNVRRELDSLACIAEVYASWGDSLLSLKDALRDVNEALWDIEDRIRVCERDRDFGDRFIELARSVYRRNDRRAELKRAINELLGSSLREEKDYVAY